MKRNVKDILQWFPSPVLEWTQLLFKLAREYRGANDDSLGWSPALPASCAVQLKLPSAVEMDIGEGSGE